MNTYTITPTESFLEAAATHHTCQLPVSAAVGTVVQCDPRGVYWYTLPDVSSVVPEPSSDWLLAVGLLAVAVWRRVGR